MRWLVIRPHRAFPELDGLDPARAAGVLRDVRPGPFARAWACGVLVFVGLVGAGLAGHALLLYSEATALARQSAARSLTDAAVVGVLGGAPALLVLRLRRAFIGSRLSAALGPRRRCHACGYPLARPGLRDGDDAVCPECGRTTTFGPPRSEPAALADSAPGVT